MLNVSRGGSVVARVVAISHEFTVAAAGRRAGAAEHEAEPGGFCGGGDVKRSKRIWWR